MTHNHPVRKAGRFALPALFLLFLTLSLANINCADEPTSLGLKFLPSGETTGVRIYDSYIDTLPITTYSVKYRVNTYYSGNLIVGKSGNYTSKALIKFSGFPTDKSGATVNSAVMRLRYRNYYFPNTHTDSLAQVSFDVYRILQDKNFSTITMDSVSSSTFGTVSKGTYTGSPTADSQEVYINLNTSMVKDWLEYAANQNYPTPNYGIALTPNASSGALKGFYSFVASSDLVPQITVIYTLGGSTDTLVNNQCETMFIADGDYTPPAGEFFLQAGISYDHVIKFDLSKTNIPSTATINDAQVFLYQDPGNSIFTPQTIYGINTAFVTDSAGTKNEGFPRDYQTTGVQNVYTLRLIAPFQRWLNGETNHGMFIVPSAQSVNLDRIAFYNEHASDPNKRPRVIIKYTPRVTP
jgi:hypothetical protein